MLGRFGTIDVWVNNAGAISVGPFSAMDFEDFSSSVDIHLNAVIHATMALTPMFKRLGGGRIVNICSIAGRLPHPHMAPYIAGKFTLSGFSKAVTSELAMDGIHVTTVYPGLMRTGSYIQAVFKGDHEREYAWFAASDLTPGASMSASRAARRILGACRECNSELVLSVPAKVGALVYGIFPGLTDWAMFIYAHALPRGPSHTRKTGARSQSLFDEDPHTKPLREIGAKVKAELNQHEKTDADFNLGNLVPRNLKSVAFHRQALETAINAWRRTSQKAVRRF